MKQISSIVFGACLGVLALLLPVLVLALVDEGTVVWSSGGNIISRFHSEVTGVLDPPATIIPGVDGKFVILKSSPTKREYVLGVQDTSGTLHLYHSLNGKTWVTDWTATVGDSNVARFDIAFEQITGNAMVVYRSATNSRFIYRRYMTATATWGAATNQNTAYNANSTLSAFRLAARPGSNQLGLVYLTNNRSGSAGFWSGAAWAMWNTALTTNGTQYTGFSGVYPPMRNLDVAFMSISGTMIVGVGQNDNARMRYATRSATGVWSAVSNLGTLAGFGDYLRFESSPTTNEVALSTCMMEPNTPTYQCEFTMWNGSAWGSVATDNTSGATINGSIPTDLFWLIDSANNTRATVALYNDATTEGLDHAVSITGGSFVIQGDNVDPPAITQHEGEIIGSVISGTGNQADVAIVDATNEIYFKRVTLNNTAIAWSSVTGGTQAEITQGSNLASSPNFGRVGIALQVTPPLLVMSTTTANATSTIGSGDTSYVSNVNCTDISTCTGYVFSARKNNISVASVRLTNSGSMSLANTSNWNLGVDTNGNPNDGVSRSVSGVVAGNTVTFTFTPNLVINKGSSMSLFPSATFGNGANYPSGGETLHLSIATTTDVSGSAVPSLELFQSGTPSIHAIIAPVITGYTNNTEPLLSYSASCSSCGIRLASGAASHSLTILGRGFGLDPGVVNRASINSKVELGTTLVVNANVASWSNTTININLNGSSVGNADADFGVNFGGADALVVTAGGVKAAGINAYIFPYVSGFNSPALLAPNGAKVYDASDTDGVITLQGTRFGSVQGGSTVLALGCSSTTCASPSDSTYIESWSNTSIRARIPGVIPDSTYSGLVTLIRATPIGSSVSARTASAPSSLSMRPRLLSITPIAGEPSSTVTLTGRHLCPAGVCPGGVLGIDSDLASAPGFSAVHHITFGTSTANFWGSWSDTTVISKVPSVSPAGTTTVMVTAGGWNAGTVLYVVEIPIGATDVTALEQYPTSALAPTLITGSTSSTTQMYFGGVIGGTGPGVKWSRLAIEVQPVGSAFICPASGPCAERIAGPWMSGGGPFDCRVLAQGCSVSTSTSEGVFHWRARTEFTNDSTWYYGAWLSFGGNAENAADFTIVRAPPVITNLRTSNIDVSSGMIAWDTDKVANTLVQINKTGTFTDDCAAINGCTGQSASLVFAHSLTVNSLAANTTYFYRVRSCDIAANCTWSVVQQLQTLSAARPAKTIFYHVLTRGAQLGAGASSTSNFSITIPEAGVAFESVFVDVRGVGSTVGFAPFVGINVNGTSKTYTLPDTGDETPWRIYHKVSSLNLTPQSNYIRVTAGQDTTLSGLSADVVITYRYNP